MVGTCNPSNQKAGAGRSSAQGLSLGGCTAKFNTRLSMCNLSKIKQSENVTRETTPEEDGESVASVPPALLLPSTVEWPRLEEMETKPCLAYLTGPRGHWVPCPS